MFNQDLVRKHFPILEQKINQHPLVYFDSAATTQKPEEVIQSITQYYANHNANVHRGVHSLSSRATNLYEQAREKLRNYIGANNISEIIFCRGATEAINLVANSFVLPNLRPQDEIIITAMEHHSNIVPWQLVAKSTGAIIKVIPINSKGELILDELPKLLTKKTKILATSHISNALGTINDVKKIIEIAHAHNVPVLVDGAQALPHQRVDMIDLDCDFYAFSGHKMFGPTGIGVLYAKKNHLENMSPYQGGGEMIKSVTYSDVEYNDLPYKFEAGTPNIAGAIGLGAAVDFLNDLNMDEVHNYENYLLSMLTNEIEKIEGVNIIGTANNKAGIVSFTIDSIHPHDIATVLDQHGIAIRAGHHCAMPVMNYYKVPATARASLCFYNTEKEIGKFIDAIRVTRSLFA